MQIEIERKFLIAMPSKAVKTKCDPVYEMVQTYLAVKDRSARVRKRTCAGKTTYIYTEKKHIDAMSCEETEREVDGAEYEALLRKADPTCRPIYKTRYIYKYEGQTFEIDVYPFWDKQAVMEIELERADSAVSFPPDITILAEVTTDGAYKNHALSRRIPPQLEDIK